MHLISLTGGGYTATVRADRGANCVRLCHPGAGADILRSPRPGEEPDNPYLYGMPILFPVNRIEGGRFVFEGREYVFPINEPKTGCHLHGCLHAAPFTVTEQSGNRVVCRYRAAAGEYLGFPHAFAVTAEYTLTEAGLSHTTTVQNLSEENMPVFLGFHTTFRTVFCRGSQPGDIRVFADICEEYERNMQTYLPTGAKPAFDAVSRALSRGEFCPARQKISRHYRAGGSFAMKLVDLRRRLSVVYENTPRLPFRLLYGGGEEEYICLEPQSCLANCANAPLPRGETGFSAIPPHSSQTYTSRIYLESI